MHGEIISGLIRPILLPLCFTLRQYFWILAIHTQYYTRV